MAQHGIEMILIRRLASQLSMPMVLVDPSGDLVFFNAAASPILGRRFSDSDSVLRGEWATLFDPANQGGDTLKREELPLFIASERRRPSHRRGRVRCLDGAVRDLEGIAFPLIGQGERMLGAVSVFWEPGTPPPPGVPRGEGPLDLASPGGDRPVELLLMRQLASYLSTAIFLIGPDGSVLFFNEPAARMIGRRFEEAEQMSAEEWSALLEPTDETGAPIGVGERPMVIAARRQLPTHRRFSIRGLDGVPHSVEGLALPLVANSGRRLGAVGIFWERGDS